MNRLYRTQKDCFWQQDLVEEIFPAKSDIIITDDEFQTVEGFGGCFNELGMIAMDTLDQKQKGKIFDNLFSAKGDMRFQYCRLPIVQAIMPKAGTAIMRLTGITK